MKKVVAFTFASLMVASAFAQVPKVLTESVVAKPKTERIEIEKKRVERSAVKGNSQEQVIVNSSAGNARAATLSLASEVQSRASNESADLVEALTAIATNKDGDLSRDQVAKGIRALRALKAKPGQLSPAMVEQATKDAGLVPAAIRNACKM